MNHEMSNAERAAFEFEELLARCMGNLEFAERVLEKFQARFQEDMATLDQSLAARDIEGLAMVAHRVKGSSANIGAPGLRSKASQIEDLARAERLAEIPRHLDELRREWDRFVRSVTTRDFSAVASACGQQ